jgi:deoxyribose-phosphate aldolase
LGGALGLERVPQDLAGYIDHTLLKPESTFEQVKKLCQEAARYRFASVCVNPTWVGACAAMLKGTGVMVCTVIGFPLGATTAKVKACETRAAVQEGADEVDMVLNVGALKSGFDEVVERDIRAVVEAAGPSITSKVILETGLLTDDEKVRACDAAKRARAGFVKTSTGFGPGGATAPDIALMRRIVGAGMGVKASGGVRTQEDALKMIRAGASRIGASASVKIVNPEPEAKAAGGAAGY